MAVEQRTVGREAKLPTKRFKASCGAEMESSMREIRAHVATCETCKTNASKGR
jgi:hypothetical protein